MQLSSPPRPAARCPTSSTSSCQKRPRSTSPEQRAKRPHLLPSARKLSYSNQQQEQRRDSFPSLYTVASSLAIAASNATGTKRRQKGSSTLPQTPTAVLSLSHSSALTSSRSRSRSPFPSTSSSSSQLFSSQRNGLEEGLFINSSRSSSTDSFMGHAARLEIMDDHTEQDGKQGSNMQDLYNDSGSYEEEDGMQIELDQRHILLTEDSIPTTPTDFTYSFPSSPIPHTPPRNSTPPLPSSTHSTPQQSTRMEMMDFQLLSPPRQQGRRGKAKFSMGFKKGCLRCERQEKGHYGHIDYD